MVRRIIILIRPYVYTLLSTLAAMLMIIVEYKYTDCRMHEYIRTQIIVARVHIAVDEKITYIIHWR